MSNDLKLLPRTASFHWRWDDEYPEPSHSTWDIVLGPARMIVRRSDCRILVRYLAPKERGEPQPCPATMNDA
jgi:hypothetical protein